MYRTALRTTPGALRAARPALAGAPRRFASTATPKKKGSWKGTGLRWGLAIAAVYFYNTSPLFADEVPPPVGPAPPHFSDADLPTIDALIEEKRRQAAAAAPPPPAPTEAAQEETGAEPDGAPAPGAAPAVAAEDAHEPGSPEALEQEAAAQGAFDPETGEINWDCPCLGGMAHGPCGEEFKAAFSCFVYSKEEPKGMDCIDKFQHMQDCFRKYPEIYGSELADDDDEAAPAEDGAEALAKEDANAAGDAAPPAPENTADKEAKEAKEETAEPISKERIPKEVTPKEAKDATDANKSQET